MPDSKPTQQILWQSRHPVASADDFHDLDTRAAIHEFGHKLPRLDAEHRAHEDYMKDQHARAAAHHLAGMRAAQGAGNMDEAKKHGTMYGFHAKAMGLDPVGPVPDAIRIQSEAPDRKFVYRFQAHPADMFLSEVMSRGGKTPEADHSAGLAKSEEGDLEKGEWSLVHESHHGDYHVKSKGSKHKLRYTPMLDHKKKIHVGTYESPEKLVTALFGHKRTAEKDYDAHYSELSKSEHSVARLKRGLSLLLQLHQLQRVIAKK